MKLRWRAPNGCRGAYHFEGRLISSTQTRGHSQLCRGINAPSAVAATGILYYPKITCPHPRGKRQKEKRKRHLGEWSAGDFMDDSVVTDRIGEKSELGVKGCEAAERGCRGTGRWSVVKKEKKALSCLTDKGKWEEKTGPSFKK